MSTRGFVYLLKNDLMPTVVKVGCTSGDPFQRAAVLSSATGVPRPFDVVLFGECRDCRLFERFVHQQLALWRLRGREFFTVDAPILDAFLYVFPPDSMTVFDDEFVSLHASDPRPWRFTKGMSDGW